jgi:DNA-3-methyladenine glycosylase I
MSETGVVVGEDGVPRCGWGDSTVDYGDSALFERITLEGFQSGLSWLTILRKRPAFRLAFVGFDPVTVAQFDEARVDALLQDAGIVRNRRKIEATVVNARAVVRLCERDGEGALDRLVWSFAPDAGHRPRSLSDVPAQTPQSQALSKALKSAGFAFVGPTTMYAAMQACGLVDDHVAGCHCAVD